MLAPGWERGLGLLTMAVRLIAQVNVVVSHLQFTTCGLLSHAY